MRNQRWGGGGKGADEIGEREKGLKGGVKDPGDVGGRERGGGGEMIGGG